MHQLSTFALLMIVSLWAGTMEAGYRSEAQLADTDIPRLVDSPGLSPTMSLTPDAVAGKRPGSRFTKKDKETVKQDNASRNEGKTVCENCNTETVPAEQHRKGVMPPRNETHVDHVVPKAKGGTGDPANGQVLCRDCNIKKSDKSE